MVKSKGLGEPIYISAIVILVMKLKKIIKYKATAIKIYDNGFEHFRYEYKFKYKGRMINDRSSISTIKRCIELAKDDYDANEEANK